MRIQGQSPGLVGESPAGRARDGGEGRDRMSRHMTPVMLGLTVFPLAAIGIAAYVAVSAGPQMMPVAGAILLLACCILVAITVVAVKLSRHDRWLASQHEALRGLSHKADEALDRSARAEQGAAALDAVSAELAALRRDLREARAPHPRRAEAAAPDAGTEKPAEQLTLLLEPVVELATGSTSHYRALVGLGDGQGKMVGHDQLMHKADQGGMRGPLDLRMVKMVAPVLRRLRSRNPGLRIFVPVGRATLGSRDDASRLLTLLQKEADVAQGMVLEFAQQDLGALDTRGIENLAKLARAGATLALRDVYLAGLDLSALRQVGVRFLSFPPHAVDAGSGPSATWTEFARQARALQMQVVVGDVKTAQQAAAVTRVARYGYGPFFAPPRKVRPDAGAAPATARRAKVA